MYNTVDCYDKPGNEDKHPHKTSSQKPSPPGPSKNKNQSFRAWLMKMLEEDSCYESPKKRIVSQAFEHLIQNLKTYNRVEI